MAKESMRFTQHYAGNTVYAPFRCALMTGMHMRNAHVRGNANDSIYGQMPLTADATTVAQLLKNAGYETALIGKWGLGDPHTSGNPLEQGFDSYYGYTDQILAHNYFPEFLLRNGKKEMLCNKVVYQDSTAWHMGFGSHSEEQIDYSHDLFINEALVFLNEERKNPFFLYLPFTVPHKNGEAPEGFRMEVPDLTSYGNEKWSRDTKAYTAMISRMDNGIGQIFEKLKRMGLDDNTLVIFTSDNGPMPNETFTEFFNSNGPLKRGKRDIYEGGIRIAMIARWPEKITPASESDHVSAFWDFLTTACEMAGVEVPENIDGISYLPTLLGEPQQKHDFLYWEFPGRGYKVALRKGKWKAIRQNMKTDINDPLELYNLDTDLGEKNNIASEHPEVVAQMTKMLSEAHTNSERFPMPSDEQ